MKNLIIIITGLIMLCMVTPASAQKLGGEQVFSYRTKSEKESFDLSVFRYTGRYFGPSGGRGGMDIFTWKAVDFVILEGNSLIPVVEKDGQYIRKERYAFSMNETEITRLVSNVKPLRGEVFEEMHFSDKAENEAIPQVDARHQTIVRYTNGPDINVPFLRKEAEVFKPDMTRSFSKGYSWKIVPGPKGVQMAKERKMRVDAGLTFIPPSDVKRVYDGYDELAAYYAKNGVPSTAACDIFQRKLMDDHKLTPDDIRFIPEGFYAAIPSKQGFKDEVTWKDFQAIRLILISHEEPVITGCDECEEEQLEEKPATMKQEIPSSQATVQTEEKKNDAATSSTVTITNSYNTYYYGSLPDSTKKVDEIIDEDTIALEPLTNLRGFLMGTYGKTIHDGGSRDAYGVHVGHYPFPDSWGFARRIGLGIGYEGGGYFSSREVNHNLGNDGYYGKSYVERDNAHFDGVYATLHFIPVTSDVQWDWLSIYGSLGYRWYKADEFAVGRIFNSEGLMVEEESNMITPLTKEMLTAGFGIHLKPWRWFIIGIDAKLGKSTAGWDYGVPDMPAQFSGADKHFIMKSVSGKIGICF